MNRRRIPAIALPGAVALLTACGHSPNPPIPEPPQQVETGSRFTLRTPLDFPAAGSDLLFQNEQMVAAAKLSREMPYCRLVPESGTRGAIPPGTFTVGSVNYDERETGTTGGMTSVTRIALTADASRQGYMLSCGWPAGAPSRAFLTTQQIYNAIGGQFSMSLLR
jgi:hypothetical protein